MPSLSEDYDAIGFDLDHCLVKYNMKEVTDLLITIFLADFHMHLNYPQEITLYDSEA